MTKNSLISKCLRNPIATLSRVKITVYLSGFSNYAIALACHWLLIQILREVTFLSWQQENVVGSPKILNALINIYAIILDNVADVVILCKHTVPSRWQTTLI